METDQDLEELKKEHERRRGTKRKIGRGRRVVAQTK